MLTNDVFNSDFSYVSAKSLVTRRNQDGTVILMKMDESSFFYKINGLSAEIWSTLDTRKTAAALIEFFSGQLPAHTEHMQHSIPKFLNALWEKGLIVAEAGPSTEIKLEFKVQENWHFGDLKEFNLEQIETEDFQKSAHKDIYQDVYLDIFAGSDLRLKKDIEPIQGALGKIGQLNGITFKWNLAVAKTQDQTVHAGLIAQEVAAVMPEVVRTDLQHGILAVEYSKINSYLVEAIKELHQTVNQQGAQILELQERLGAKS